MAWFLRTVNNKLIPRGSVSWNSLYLSGSLYDCFQWCGGFSLDCALLVSNDQQNVWVEQRKLRTVSLLLFFLLYSHFILISCALKCSIFFIFTALARKTIKLTSKTILCSRCFKGTSFNSKVKTSLWSQVLVTLKFHDRDTQVYSNSKYQLPIYFRHIFTVWQCTFLIVGTIW